MAFHGLKMLSKGDVYPALKTTFMKCTCNIVQGKAFNWYLTKFKQSNGCDYNSDKNWYLFFDFSICIHFHSESPENMWKLSLSRKFPHQEIRWNYGILRSAHCVKTIQNQIVKVNFLVSVLSPNTAKYGPKITWHSKTFYTMG